MSTPLRRAVLRTLSLAAALPAVPAAGQPAWQPSRPVKVVVGAPTGGPSDFLARMMADAFGPRLGQPFVVENKPGASGMPAADSVAKASADAQTLLVSGPASIAVAPHLFPRIAYDPVTDLAPVAMLGAGAFVLVVHPSVPARNLADLIRTAKAQPGALAYGSGGNGSSGHLCTELFGLQAGTKMLHVPYKGDGQAIGDLLAGQIQVMFTAPNVAMAHVKGGRLRLLAVTTRDRVASLPDVPTVHETLPDFEYLGWVVAFAPASTPAPALDTLATTWRKVREEPAIRRRLDELAMAPPERLIDRADVTAFVRKEHGRLGRLIREAGIRAES